MLSGARSMALCFFMGPVQEAGEEGNTFYSGKVLDKSIQEVLMHRCFLSSRTDPV